MDTMSDGLNRPTAWWFSSILSAIALLFSGFTYYENSLRHPDLSVYVPPMIHYARDGDNDVFNVPVTISNEGARTGTVLNMVLEVENLQADAEKKTARFHSAFLGEWPRTDTAELRSFAPISIAGNGTFTETIRFYPMDEPLPFLVHDKGNYRFTLRLETAEPADPNLLDRFFATKPTPLQFELKLPFMAFQHLAFQRGTIAMFNADWKSAIATSAIAKVTAPSEPPSATTPPPDIPPGDPKSAPAPGP